MPEDLSQLVRDTVELTGVSAPRLLDADAPTLSLDGPAGDFYIVGLIGGKEVGKSAMVNALAGREISHVTSHGAGTDGVVAYVHQSQESVLRQLLDREAPGQYRLVVHDLKGDAARVLLDLPDIDSHFQHHLVLTRRMLRHMLYPIWMVSIEKYADQQPRDMLARVAEGNDPRNFIFVLNKADQLQGDADALDDLRQDYARRIAETLRIDTPRVWVVSAARPGEYDLPALRVAMKRDRSAGEVNAARAYAKLRQSTSLAGWLKEQNLADRADRLDRLSQEAEDLLAARLAAPLLEQAIAQLTADAAYWSSLADDAMAARVARWPLLQIIHTLLSPLLSMLTMIVRGGTARAAGLADGLVDAHLLIDGQSPDRAVRAAFAHLHQTSPVIVGLYARRKLWEDMEAQGAVMQLRRRLIETIQRQREQIIRPSRSFNPLWAICRWLLTVGALLWFPFIQPILELALQDGWLAATAHIGLLAVQLLSATYLLTTAAFLSIYFVALWLSLRWQTQRRAGRLLEKWAHGRGDKGLNPTQAVAEWVDDLLEPIKQERDAVRSLVKRLEAIERGE